MSTTASSYTADVLSIACACGAAAGERCKTRSGGWSPAHVSRRVEADAMAEIYADLDTPDLETADEFSEYDDDTECEGHESLDGAHMGETVYCDGSCRPDAEVIELPVKTKRTKKAPAAADGDRRREHAQCSHPSTKTARAACRRQRAKLING